MPLNACSPDPEVANGVVVVNSIDRVPFDGLNPAELTAAIPEATADGLPTWCGHPYAVGASFGIRADLYAELGGCDVRFSICSDDIDLSLRAGAAGCPPAIPPDLFEPSA